jgi:uncharacterized membrane protein (DUF4010 family)
MLSELTRVFPIDALKVALVLALSFVIGLEREEHKQRDASYAFGGIRTFPIIGLVGYALALVSAPGLWPWSFGLLVVGGLMVVSYVHKVDVSESAGITSELSALATYLIGALVYGEHFWLAGTIGILSLLLLELKEGLEGLANRVPPGEILSAAKFLLLTVVILPIVPNRELTPFGINPFKTWLVVVAVCGISYGSYLLQKAVKARGGVFVAGLLGGIYSSTATTIVLAKQSNDKALANLYAGSILAASGMMYARLATLIALFNGPLGLKLAPSFAGLAIVGAVVGLIVSRRTGARAEAHPPMEKNPLQLKAAFLFAFIFVTILVLTSLARSYLGTLGLYAFAVIAGIADVDPFIIGLAQSSGAGTPLDTSATAIVLAAASNNLAKGGYAYSFADRTTGRLSLALLVGFAILGLVPFAWM